jgi:uncharacterized peroxidase-related enzyme
MIMSRLNTVTAEQLSAEQAELFVQIKRKLGRVPNAYVAIGSNAPKVLAQALQHNAMLSGSTLTSSELEAINLAVSQATGCDYCLAAHTVLGKLAGFSPEQIKKLRNGKYDENSKVDALVRFVVGIVTTSGTIPLLEVEQVRAAGYDDRQIVEIISAVSAIFFTNLINRVNDTDLDFPKVT